MTTHFHVKIGFKNSTHLRNLSYKCPDAREKMLIVPSFSSRGAVSPPLPVSVLENMPTPNIFSHLSFYYGIETDSSFQQKIQFEFVFICFFTNTTSLYFCMGGDYWLLVPKAPSYIDHMTNINNQNWLITPHCII